MFQFTAPIPDDLPAGELLTLGTRLQRHLGLEGDGLRAMPDCGMFSVTRATREEAQAVFDDLTRHGMHIKHKPYQV